MKPIFLLALIASNIALFAQDDSIEIIQAPTLTEIGKPIGEKVSQKINKEGGQISSADGRLDLIIPENALKSKTNISIQTVINTLSPGKEYAYQLEPSGITFQQPAKIIFHYSKKDYEGGVEALKGISFQDEKGQWYRLRSTVIDTINKTISGDITHFSRWSDFDLYSLVPSNAKVKVSKKVYLQIVKTDPPGENGDPGNNMVLIPLRTRGQGSNRKTWSVNGIVGGNSLWGTVAQNTLISADFTAPTNVPDRNPVEVSVQANADFTFNNNTFHTLTLISNITIYDKAYEITVIGHNQQNVLQCTITTIDSSSCILQLNGDRSKIQDIQNMNFKMTITGCPCNLREINPGASIGPVNIVGATRIYIVPANPPQKPYEYVTIDWIRNMGSIGGMAIDPCVGNPSLSWPWMSIPAVPMPFGFEAKDDEQFIKGGDEKNGFVIKIKPIKEDN